MSYVRVETSVPKHPKFLKAGPAASWLWLCGVAYCQDGLTDGFIPESALPFLGVSKPGPMACVLVDAKLWLKVDGGWQVNDYLEHNNSADHVRKVKASRKAAGHLGGRPEKQTLVNSVKQFALSLFNQTKNPSTATATDTATASDTSIEQKQERWRVPPSASSSSQSPFEREVRWLKKERAQETKTGQPAVSVIAALARQVLETHPGGVEDEGEWLELIKAACVKANLLYDSVSVGRAIDMAKAQLRRRKAS